MGKSPVEIAISQARVFCIMNNCSLVLRPLPKGFAATDIGKNIHTKGKSSDMPHTFLNGKIITQSAFSKSAIRNDPARREESNRQNLKTISYSNKIQSGIVNAISKISLEEPLELKGFNMLNSEKWSPDSEKCMFSTETGNLMLSYNELGQMLEKVSQDSREQLLSSFNEALFDKAGIASEDINKIQIERPVINGREIVGLINKEGTAFPVDKKPNVYEKIGDEYFLLDNNGAQVSKLETIPNGFTVNPINEITAPKVGVNINNGKFDLILTAESSQKADIDVLAINISAASMNHTAKVYSIDERISAETIKTAKERDKTLDSLINKNPTIDIFKEIKNNPDMVMSIEEINTIDRTSPLSNKEKKMLSGTAKQIAEQQLSHFKGIGGTTDLESAVIANMRAGGITSSLITHGAENRNWYYNQPMDDHWVSIDSNGLVSIVKSEDQLAYANSSNTTSNCLLDMSLKELNSLQSQLGDSNKALNAKVSRVIEYINKQELSVPKPENLTQEENELFENLSKKGDTLTAKDIACLSTFKSSYLIGDSEDLSQDTEVIKTFNTFKLSLEEGNYLVENNFITEEAFNLNMNPMEANPNWGWRRSDDGRTYNKDEELVAKISDFDIRIANSKDDKEKQSLLNEKVALGLSALEPQRSSIKNSHKNEKVVLEPQKGSSIKNLYKKAVNFFDKYKTLFNAIPNKLLNETTVKASSSKTSNKNKPIKTRAKKIFVNKTNEAFEGNVKLSQSLKRQTKSRNTSKKNVRLTNSNMTVASKDNSSNHGRKI